MLCFVVWSIQKIKLKMNIAAALEAKPAVNAVLITNQLQ